MELGKCLMFQLTPAAARDFYRLTGSHQGRRLVLVSCLDNLLKGAASQAVQNMNLMYGWPEQEGLQ